MFDLDLWREIFQSINKNRTRSLLSGFTVAFAILLFVLLFGIVKGFENTFAEAFGDDATNSIFIYSGATSTAFKGLQAGRKIQLKNEDQQYILDEFGNKVEYITSRIYKNVNASFNNEKNNYELRAVNPDHQYLERTKVVRGRYINEADIKNETKVVVIGRLIDEDLFLKTTPIGKYINLNGIQYKVVGVFEDDGGDNEERMIYMPLTTAQRIYGNNDYVDQINLSYNPDLDFDSALDFSLDLEESLKKKFFVAPIDQRAIRVRNRAAEVEQVNQMAVGLSIIVLVIGFGTLIAGIVGISNIMIFIVKERTKEIGVRKALGAAPKSIVSLILLEAILITTIAGYIGLLVGVGVLELIGPSLETYFIKDPAVSTNLVISATITLIVAGGIAGYVPAKNASRIKPIVALRDD